MGIQILNPRVQPAVTYDRIHLTRLEIEQPTFTNDNNTPKYRVTIECRYYGVDVHGQRHYQGDTQEVVIKDFIAVAMDAANSGDMTLLGALAGIESAVAKIISSQTETSAEVAS